MIHNPKRCFLILLITVLSLTQLPFIALGETAVEEVDADDSMNYHGLKDPHQATNQGIYPEYNFKFVNNRTIIIEVENKNNREVLTALSVEIDGEELYEKSFNLTGGESRRWKFNITPHLSVVEKNHTVTVATYNKHSKYNFTREINSSTTESIPKPHITNVEVTDGTIDGEPSAVAKVSVSNPSIQAYGTKLMVFTEGTDGSFYDATLPPGENRTITVELLDQRGAKVAGEARLYTENLSRSDGAMDQVEFVGQAGEDTTVWNESYEPVKAPWRTDNYEYQNESIQTGADETGVVPGLSWTQEFYAGLGVALLGVVGLKRKLT